MAMNASELTLAHQVSVFAHNPLPVVVLVLAVGFLIWKVLEWRHGGINARLKDERDNLEKQLGELREQANKHPPVPAPEAKTNGLSISEKSKLGPKTVVFATEKKNSEAERRTFLPEHVTVHFLAEQRRGKTDVQADAALSIYIGKWMRITGPVFNVTSNPSFATISLSQQGSKPEAIFGEGVHCRFPRHLEQLAVIHRDQMITIVGKIQAIDARGVDLQECELEAY